MKFLWPGAQETNLYGVITAPNHRGILRAIQNGSLWAGDLGALIGPDFVKKINFNVVAEWLDIMLPYQSQCLFLAGGDIVGDANGTLETYDEFHSYFSGWPLAYVAQNGAESLPIPESCSAIFIGGVPLPNGADWKDSIEAVSVIKRGQNMEKHIHIGRVNGWRRYSHFSSLPGSKDFTCDGTRVRFDGVENTLKAYRDYESRPKQHSLL